MKQFLAAGAVSLLPAFSAAAGTGDLAEYDILPIGVGHDQSIHHVDNIGMNRATNFRYILETGQTHGMGLLSTNPDFSRIRMGAAEKSLYVDWDSDDAYTQALGEIEHDVSREIADNPLLQQLLNDEEWDIHERLYWEKTVSGYVSGALQDIQGLERYRISEGRFISGDDNGVMASERTSMRSPRMNDLSGDIENGTYMYEFDCEAMSVTEGVIMQRIEDSHLPDDVAGAENYKQASSYFYATGFMGAGNPDTAGGHAFIVSSATGGVIEATSMEETVFRPPPQSYSFEQFIAGVPFRAEGSQTYYFGEYTQERRGEARLDQASRSFDSMESSIMMPKSQLSQYLLVFETLPEGRTVSAFLSENDSMSTEQRDELDAIMEGTHAEIIVNFAQNSLDDLIGKIDAMSQIAAGDPEREQTMRDIIHGMDDMFAGHETRMPYGMFGDQAAQFTSYQAAESLRSVFDWKTDNAREILGMNDPDYERVIPELPQLPTFDIKF